jgi:outer membrane protein assembly factor BamA
VIRISIQEGTPGIVAGGPGYRNDLGIRAFGQAAYTNLWGLNHTVSLVANVNRRFWSDPALYYRFVEYQAQLSYVWPWFAGQKDLTFRPMITSSETEYILFDATTTELDLTWEKPILKTPNLVGLFTYSLERVNQFHALSSTDNNQLRIGSITPALRLDLRDNPLSPTSGFFATTSYEYAAPWLYSQNGVNQQPVNGQLSPATGPIGYYRWQLRTDYFVPIPGDITWYLSFRTGYERNNEANGEIPLIKQFALGGIGSLRGFGEQALNIQAIQLQGTASYVNYRTQVDFPFTGALKIGPFLDAANLLVDQYSLSYQLEAGAGVGLHYQSPVGPINFDWAFNLTTPQPGQETQQFYFSIGVL